MPRELRKKLSRRVGPFVVLIDHEGVEVRAPHKRLSVKVGYRQLVKAGLENAGYSLTEEEWNKPLDMLRRLARTPRRRPPRVERQRR